MLANGCTKQMPCMAVNSTTLLTEHLMGVGLLRVTSKQHRCTEACMKVLNFHGPLPSEHPINGKTGNLDLGHERQARGGANDI